MNGQTPIWRAILWIEKFLPTPAAYPSPPGDASVAGARASRGRFAFAAIFPLIIVLPIFVRQRAVIVEMWWMWRPMILQLLLFVAVAAALAAIVAGVVTWRSARRNHA